MSTTSLNSLGRTSGFAPVMKPTIPQPPFSDGGIVEQPSNKPKPGAIEERPTTIDWETGERVYVDEYLKDKFKPHVCYLA